MDKFTMFVLIFAVGMHFWTQSNERKQRRLREEQKHAKLKDRK